MEYQIITPRGFENNLFYKQWIGSNKPKGNWIKIDIDELKEQHNISKDKFKQEYQCNWDLDATNK